MAKKEIHVHLHTTKDHTTKDGSFDAQVRKALQETERALATIKSFSEQMYKKGEGEHGVNARYYLEKAAYELSHA